MAVGILRGLVMKAVRRLCAVAFIVFAGAANAAGNAYFDGLVAFDARDYQKARTAWNEGAKAGDARSLFGLGQLYELGYGVERDTVRAHALYSLSARSGSKPAARAADSLASEMTGADLDGSRVLARRMREERSYLADAAPAMKTTAPRPAADKPATVAAPEKKQAGAAAKKKPAVEATRTAGPRTAALDLEYLCDDLRLAWHDQGSGGTRDVSLFTPGAPERTRIIGGMAQGNHADAQGCLGTLGPGKRDSGLVLLAPPVEWERVWTDRGSGARMDGSVWRAKPPNADFVCLGDVGQSGYDRPSVPGYVCVNRCLTRTVPAGRPVWTDEGTGAAESIAIYALPLSNSFVAHTGRNAPGKLTDLDPAAACLR